MSRRSAGLLAAGLAPAAYHRALALGLRFNAARSRAGDLRLHLLLCREDVRFSFPGDSSWAAAITSKADLERWLMRFAAAGVKLHPEEIVIAGPPWRTTFCMRCTAHADAPDGRRVYANRAVLWGHVAWGRVRDYEVYEDTLQTRAFDEYLDEAA